MDFNEIYHFLFETFPGMGVLIGGGIVISVIVCVVLERRTRRIYRDRGPAERDEWSLFEGAEEGEQEEEREEARKEA